MITIQAPPGVRLTDLARQLTALAGDDRDQVRSGRGGVVVTEALAHTYLTRRLFGPPPPAPPQTPVPPAVAQVIQQAELTGGLHTPVMEPDEPAPGRRRTRKQTAGPPAHSKEQARGV